MQAFRTVVERKQAELIAARQQQQQDPTPSADAAQGAEGGLGTGAGAGLESVEHAANMEAAQRQLHAAQRRRQQAEDSAQQQQMLADRLENEILARRQQLEALQQQLALAGAELVGRQDRLDGLHASIRAAEEQLRWCDVEAAAAKRSHEQGLAGMREDFSKQLALLRQSMAAQQAEAAVVQRELSKSQRELERVEREHAALSQEMRDFMLRKQAVIEREKEYAAIKLPDNFVDKIAFSQQALHSPQSHSGGAVTSPGRGSVTSPGRGGMMVSMGQLEMMVRDIEVREGVLQQLEQDLAAREAEMRLGPGRQPADSPRLLAQIQQQLPQSAGGYEDVRAGSLRDAEKSFKELQAQLSE